MITNLILSTYTLFCGVQTTLTDEGVLLLSRKGIAKVEVFDRKFAHVGGVIYPTIIDEAFVPFEILDPVNGNHIWATSKSGAVCRLGIYYSAGSWILYFE